MLTLHKIHIFSWDARAIHLDCQRQKKKKSGTKITKEYRLELENVNAQSEAEVVEEHFGPIFKEAGCEWVLGDNDKELHSDVPKTKVLHFLS